MGIIATFTMVTVAAINLVAGMTGRGEKVQPVPADMMNQQVTVNVNVKPKQVRSELTRKQDLVEKLALPAWSQKIGNFLYSQRYFIAAGAVLGSYVLICRECVRANKYVECCQTWAAWHNDYSLEILLSIPHQEIAKDLVVEIQRRYSNEQNPTDFIGPLITFSKSIDAEINIARYFLRLYTFIERSHTSLLFPLDMEKCAALHTIVHRLECIKSIFLSWAADYKIEHNRARLQTLSLS